MRWHWALPDSSFRLWLPLNSYAAAKKSRCRPAQGRRLKHEGITRMPAQTQANQTACAAKTKTLLLDPFSLNMQHSLHAKSIFSTKVHPIVSATKLPRRLDTAHLALEHRMLNTFERFDLQIQRLRDALQRELTINTNRRIAIKLDRRPFEGRRRILRHIEEIARPQMLVELRIPRLDRRCIHRDIHRARLRGTIKRHSA